MFIIKGVPSFQVGAVKFISPKECLVTDGKGVPNQTGREVAEIVSLVLASNWVILLCIGVPRGFVESFVSLERPS